MLRYETIHAVNAARRRMMGSGRTYYSWRSDGVNREQDQLNLFTFEQAAIDDSRHNLEWLFDVARGHDQRWLVLAPMTIQTLGWAGTDRVARDITPGTWITEFRRWLDSEHQDARTESSDRAEIMHFHTWRRCFTTKEHQGVYEVATGRRLTSREEIIESFWDMGFATWRGRPYSVAKQRWSGNRTELEDLTDLYHQHYSRHRTSDMAKKMVSAFRSINRYAAWPGAW